jgi:hypothetical protein
MTVALYAVAALLAGNLIALLARNDNASFLPQALAQRQPPIAGGGGLFVMPAQLSGNRWGCYLMDVDRGTLCVYEYQAGSTELKFQAARNFSNDTRLASYNTTPKPQEILDLVNKQNQAVRGGAGGGEEPSKEKNN